VHHNGGDYFVQMHEKVLGYPRYKPLTYFCFDVMDNSNNDNNLETVALTCPRKSVDVGIEIFKCCPMGETFNNASLKVSISSTFYKQLFCLNLFFVAFLYLRFDFVIFWQKNIGEKAAHKMLVKFSKGVQATSAKPHLDDSNQRSPVQ